MEEEKEEATSMERKMEEVKDPKCAVLLSWNCSTGVKIGS